jgi:hypothetical protein
MTEVRCVSCRKPCVSKTDFDCECCGERACKSCQEFLPEGTFSFRNDLPEELTHSRYCRVCHEREILPALESYEQTLEQAKQTLFFYKTYARPLPILRRAADPLRVNDCDDRDETILRLAFQTVEAGYNAVIEATITSEKVRNEGYQTTHWKGVATPAELDLGRLERRGYDQD